MSRNQFEEAIREYMDRGQECDSGSEEDEDEVRLMQELTKGLRINGAPNADNEADGEKREQTSHMRSRRSVNSKRGCTLLSLNKSSSSRSLTQNFTFVHSKRWEIERANKTLLSRIAFIHSRKSSGSTSKNIGSSATKPILFGVKSARDTAKTGHAPRQGSAGTSNKFKQQQIARENEAFAKRLSSIKTSISGIKRKKSRPLVCRTSA